MDQTHFNTWKEIEETYQKLQVKNEPQPQEQDQNQGKGQDQDQGITKKPKVGHRQAEQQIYQQLQQIYLNFIRMLLECFNQ